MGTKITFKRPDGKDAAGYLAKAGRANAPGVVVIQEWWGLQDQIRGICDRFAVCGYEALAPDLYAKHGFMNEQRPDAHQRQAAELAWSRTLEFWARHLGR